MTKISSKTAYPKKKPISSDYFVGTDSEDFNKTVNFGFEEVAGLVNKLNGTPLLNYLFSTSPYLSTEVLLEGRFLSDENELSTPSLTKLHVNKFNNSGDNLQELYLFLQANATDFYLKLRNSNNQNNAVYFDISSIEDFPDYFILNISIFKENEFLPLLQNLNVYFFDFELKSIATGASDPLKLDKGGYEGTAQDLNNSIKNIAFPDQVLKIGEIVITGLNAFVSAGDFQWRLNQVDFLTAPEFSEDIDPATDGFNRTDILEGDNAGIIHLKKGTENEAAAPGPEVTTGRIILAGIPVFGSTVGTPILLPNYDDKYLKRYKSTYKTVQSIFNIEPSQDDYNVIFNNTTNSEIRIYENGHNGKFIKNGAIYPFKSFGSGNVVVVAQSGAVIINDPNGLTLNKNQQCYLIKDNNNEWTLVNPRNLQNIDNTSDATKPVSSPQQTALDLKVDKVTGKGLSTEDYTTSEKNKLASIDATHYLPPLQMTVQLSALPQATVSDKARVYVENDLSDYFYDVTASSGDIAPDDQSGGIGFWRKVAVGGETAASIKTKYESNADTNAFTNALKAKLDSITEIFTTALKTGYDGAYTWISTNGSAVLAHISSAHAPSNAQKNSDITKSEIEAKLTGEITTHTHPAVGGGGDMVLASTQTVSGLKTFLSGMLGLRNIANTFTSFFTNANTASRTYTLQNRDGTLADLTDIASVNTNKMNVPTGGIANYLPKFLTPYTQTASRLWDTGTYLGIGTSNTPTKDITLGNQDNREIGIEESQNTTVGRELIIKAGRTINFVYNTLFNALNQTSRNWRRMAAAPNGNVYAVVDNGDIYMQTGGTGNFVSLGQTSRTWAGIAAAPNGNVYASVYNGDIYMQTGGTGNFVALGQTSRTWRGMAAAPNGNVYAVVEGGDIYMQTGGTGNFVALGQTSRTWRGIAAAPNGNVYAGTNNGDIYMQTGGTGNFVALGQTSRTWTGIAAAPNGNVYAVDEGGDIYMQTGGTGNFVSLGQTSRTWTGIVAAPNGNVYAGTNNGDIYMQNNDTVGTSNLDGGTLKQIAGTGKGTGKSRFEIYTGQKTASGTDMQIETLREYIDENGYHVYTSMPVFADNLEAITGGLPVGCQYRTPTGDLKIVY